MYLSRFESLVTSHSCTDEELNTLKGIEGETFEEKAPQQVVSLHIYSTP